MLKYAELYANALKRFASEDEMERALPKPASARKLSGRDDAYYLSEMSRRVFRAGFRHAVVDAKWPVISAAFHQFDPVRVAMMSDEELEALMTNSGIIRHWRKIKATRDNAAFVLDIGREYQGVGRWLADWPVNNVVGLWQEIKKRGTSLGGNSAPAFLRMVGKDTFLLTNDVIAVLQAHRIIDKPSSSLRVLGQLQIQFNEWAEESSRPLCQISRMLSYLAA
jgi:3-methyladenine DNA glycosylase Tag